MKDVCVGVTFYDFILSSAKKKRLYLVLGLAVKALNRSREIISGIDSQLICKAMTKTKWSWAHTGLQSLSPGQIFPQT